MASIGFPEAKPLTQKNRFLKVYSSFPEDTLLLEAFSGAEHVSSSFQFFLSLISNLKDIELKEIIGKVMKVALRTASGQNRYFNGYVRHSVIYNHANTSTSEHTAFALSGVIVMNHFSSPNNLSRAFS